MRLTLRRARLLTAGWALFMLALTSWPSPPEVPVVSSIPDFDKVVHALLYGVLGFLASFSIDCALSFRCWKRRKSWPMCPELLSSASSTSLFKLA